MKSDHLVSLAQYEFRTLRKHMLSMYAELHFHENATTEFKREFCRKLVPRFFARIRNYRKVSLETISRHSGYSKKDLEKFESGKLEIIGLDQLRHSYRHACGAYREVDYFNELIEEFMNPIIRESKKNQALEYMRMSGGHKFETIRYDILGQNEPNIIHLNGIQRK